MLINLLGIRYFPVMAFHSQI
ncbi:CRISPR-associated DxTHG motif protein [Rossellomorea aquimaris]|nr:CRISPR-associated DxTHG motif protein [Rossellomorea aquimaris]